MVFDSLFTIGNVCRSNKANGDGTKKAIEPLGTKRVRATIGTWRAAQWAIIEQVCYASSRQVSDIRHQDTDGCSKKY
jgi:hypothetical protein